MARFEVYLNPGPLAATTPYLLEIQSDLLDGLDTTVVIPLRRRDAFPATPLPATLIPGFAILGVDCLLETPKLAAIPRRLLKAPVASLTAEASRITAAIELLLQGY